MIPHKHHKMRERERCALPYILYLATVTNFGILSTLCLNKLTFIYAVYARIQYTYDTIYIKSHYRTILCYNFHLINLRLIEQKT